MSNSNFQKKRPYIEKQINELKFQGNYCIIGEITEVTEQGFNLADETGKIEIIKSGGNEQETFTEGEYVRVFGFVEEGLKVMRSTIIQKLQGIDINLYRKVRSVEKSVFE